MSETAERAMRHTDVEAAIEEIDGMNYYGVTLTVREYNPDEKDIRVSLWKNNSTRHVDRTRLYYGSSHYDGTERWRCVMHKNRAVVDKALETLNEVRAGG